MVNMLISGTAGESMTHETAENILVGHFEPNDHRHSWLVAAGSNPAYEQFALQCPRIRDMMLTNAYNTWEWMVVVLQSACTKKTNPSNFCADATRFYSSTILVVFVQLELDMEIRLLLHTVSSSCY